MAKKKVKEPLKKSKKGHKKVTDNKASNPPTVKSVEAGKVVKTEVVAKKAESDKIFKIKNIGSNVAKEVKPGLGVFTINPNEVFTTSDAELARSLVGDSQGKLIFVD